MALAFWQSTARDDVETRAKIRKRKLHRTKAYEWLLAVSHMVLIATGSQLTRHQQVEDKAARKDPATWPCATVCIDQRSDGRSACHWLIHLRHNILLLHDWCKRVWNNVELAIADMHGLALHRSPRCYHAQLGPRAMGR